MKLTMAESGSVPRTIANISRGVKHRRGRPICIRSSLHVGAPASSHALKAASSVPPQLADEIFGPDEHIEVSDANKKKLRDLTTTIYREHWIKTLKLDKRSMISGLAIAHKIDLQPILEAIVSRAVTTHERVIAHAIQETLSFQEVAKLDETKEADTQKLLGPHRKRARLQESLEKELSR